MSRPNIVLFVLDTLRPDYLGCYGSNSANTPTIDQIADRGVMFENAFSAGPATPQSHASLFSGKYPSEVGVVGARDHLPDDIPVLASWLKKEGYETFGVCGPGTIGKDYGFGRGFDTYREVFSESLSPELSFEYIQNVVDNGTVREDFFRTLSKGLDNSTSVKFDLLKEFLGEPHDGPLFAFINQLTPHTPWDPPRYYKEEATPEIDRPKWFITQFLLEELFDYSESISRPEVRPERLLKAARANDKAYRFYSDQDWLTEEELQILRTWYTASIEYLDDQLNEFMEWFDQTDLKDDTILIVTADHGECLGAHDQLYHATSLHDEILHVPLIIDGAEQSIGSSRSDLISLTDLFDTICDLVGIPHPKTTSGQSIMSDNLRDAIYAEFGIRDVMKEPLGPHLNEEDKQLYSLGRKCTRTEEYKLVYMSDGRKILKKVPGDKRMNNPPEQLVEDLYEKIRQNMTGEFQHMSYDDKKVGRKTLQNLRELGYLN